MNDHLPIEEISRRFYEVANEFTNYCSTLSDEQFFSQPTEKWSVAQQTRHITIATKMTGLAFTLPKFAVRLIGGKPNRSSRSYDELVEKYKLKLQQGGRASGRYVPKPVPASQGKEIMLMKFTAAMKKIALTLKQKWKEPQLDNYIAPHPLLGKITLRELCYFTIYHTYHHLESVKKISTKNKDG